MIRFGFCRTGGGKSLVEPLFAQSEDERGSFAGNSPSVLCVSTLVSTLVGGFFFIWKGVENEARSMNDLWIGGWRGRGNFFSQGRNGEMNGWNVGCRCWELLRIEVTFIVLLHDIYSIYWFESVFPYFSFFFLSRLCEISWNFLLFINLKLFKLVKIRLLVGRQNIFFRIDEYRISRSSHSVETATSSSRTNLMETHWTQVT